MCDDVLRGIFARVPARTAVASMTLSRDHQALLRCPEFRALHCRLALPDPHVAYIAMAKVRRSGAGGDPGRKQPVSGYHGFHVAGAGFSGSAPMRALAGATCPMMKYVSTCHGVVLLAVKARPATCVLWNPAIADDEEEEVRVPISEDDDCAVLGMGYSRRSKTYKLLLSRQRKVTSSSWELHPKELLVYALGGGVEQPRLRTLLLEGLKLDGDISSESLYLDGTIYLLHVDRAVILAFNVDHETVTAIDLPDEGGKQRCEIMSTTLLLISGRPCVDTKDTHGRALWLLTAEHQWERKCAIDDDERKCAIDDDERKCAIDDDERKCVIDHDEASSEDDEASSDDDEASSDNNHCLDHDLYSIAGVWDCNGVLFMYLRHKVDSNGKLCMYRTATQEMIEVNLPHKLAPPEAWAYAMCWGYKPTLVSPGSIVVGEAGVAISHDEEERRACHC